MNIFKITAITLFAFALSSCSTLEYGRDVAMEVAPCYPTADALIRAVEEGDDMKIMREAIDMQNCLLEAAERLKEKESE